MPNVVTITPLDVAIAVADELNLVSDWSMSFDAAAQSWLPDHTEEEFAKLQIDVMPIMRERERNSDQGATRAHLRSEHTVKVWMQKLVDPRRTLQKPEMVALTKFIHQVDDYFLAKHRKLNQVAGHAAGADNVYAIRSKVTTYSPKDLDEHRTWVGVLELTFTERTAW